MAEGRSIGTVFVELDLDPSRYTKGQQQLYKDATRTSLSIEENFKKLGIKSSAEFDLMRQKASNAFEGIKNSHKATANDIMRAEQAKADAIKRINEQQFGHQTTIIEGLKKNWIAAAAVITTAMIGINKAWDLANIGAEYAEQRGILDNLANKYKTTADDIVKSMQKASDGLIAKSDLMQVALGGLAKGLKPEQLTNLADAALILGDAVGKDATTALKDLTEALETGRARGLKTYTGQTISLKDAFGELESKLTDVEKAQAMYDLTMIHTAELQNQQAKAVDNAKDKIERMTASYNNAKLAAGNFFKTIVAGIYDMVTALGSVSGNYDITGMGAQPGYVSPGRAKGKGDKIAPDGDLTKGQLAELDMALLKRQLSTRAKSSAGSSSNNAARDAEREAERLAREQERARKEAERAAEKAEKDRLDALHEQAEAQMKLNADMIAGAEKYRDLMAQMNIDMADDHEAAIMRIMEDDRQMYENINKLMDDGVISFDEAMKAYEKLAEKTGKSIEEIFKEDLIKATETFRDQLRDLSFGFSMLSNACLDMAASYEEGSSAARHWEEAAKAFEVAQRAVAVVQAVAAIATQGLGDPYTAFARIAAMTAAMASLLATIGESVGGGSSSSASVKSTSTALGSEEASNSVENSFKLLEDIYDIENTKLTKIYNELKDLNSNITGLVTTIFRTGGISAEGMGISVGTEKGQAEKLLSSYIYQDVGFLTKVGNFLNQPVLDIANFIFGGKVKTKVTGTGISFGDQSIADILSGGMDAMQYADIKKTKYSLFGSKKTSYSTQYQALDSEVSAMFDKVFQGMGQSLVYFAENLGTSVNDVLNYTFEQTKINLQDMTAEEMNAAISEYISTVSDNAASALFGDIISQYQQLEEGLFETATRLIVDKEIVLSVLEDTGKAFTMSVPQMIAFSEQMIDIAGGLEELTEAAQSYIDKFYTDAEKFASTRDSIRDVAGILPRTRDDYRKLVESIDLTSDVGKQAYYTLMQLAGTADSYYSHIEEIASQRADMEIELLNAQGKAEEALALSRKRELDAMDESLRPLQELIWLTQDLGTSLETITSTVTTEINALISTSSNAASESRRMAQTYKGLIETLTEAQIKIFGGGKAGAQTRLNDIYGKAMTGDVDALGKMPDAINTLLSESLATAQTSLEYRRDQAKSYIALENAKNVSTAMVNWEEYHATLLETQVKVLEDIRDDIANNNLTELQKHADLLGNIATLLSQQTVQVVKGNTYVQDQTGKIVAQTAVVGIGNSYAQDQIGKIVAGNELTTKQTAQIITGNATQDVIKNLDAENTSYTSEMLSALVAGGSTQTNSLLSILSSSTTIISLLGQLITVFEDNEKNVSLKEIELSKSEYTKAMADVTETNKAVRSAIIAAENAKSIEQQKIAAYGQAADVSSWAASIYNQNPTAANKALYLEKYAAANTAWESYSAAAANYKTAVAQQEALQTLASQQYTTAMTLKSVTNKLITAYNKEYPDDKIPALAEGGYVMVGENGPELARFGSSARVYSNKDSKALLDNKELIAEIKKLNATLEKHGYAITANTKKTSDTLRKFDVDGMPAERAA